MPCVFRRSVCVPLLVMALLLPQSAFAQRTVSNSEPVVPEKVGKDIHAFRITGTPPTIDGRADDEVWTKAQAIDDFVQNEPDNMAAPADRTVVQIAYDDRVLYVMARCYTKDPGVIATGLGRRDNLPPSDLIRLSFDPRHDHQNAYVFETNPSGMLSDYLFYDDTRQSPDYDAVWDVPDDDHRRRLVRGIFHSVFADALHRAVDWDRGVGLQSSPGQLQVRRLRPLGPDAARRGWIRVALRPSVF